MEQRYSLSGLGDERLLVSLRGLIQRGNQLNADVLAHLAEVDERRVHMGLGFSSLFAYCVESLGLSESAAGRRIAAARVCRRFAGVFERVSNGELHLSALCALAPHLNSENAVELLDVCSCKSRRQVEQLLAARFPKADVRESTRALSENRYEVRFTAGAEFLDLFERGRGLLSHRFPVGGMEQVLTLALEALVREQEKQRFAVGRKPRVAAKVNAAKAARSLPPGESVAVRQGERSKRTRSIPAAAAREVYERDERQCGFVSKDGRRCGARMFLELDHVTPFAAGGESVVGNLRVRCRAHNQWHARRWFGRGWRGAAAPS